MDSNSFDNACIDAGVDFLHNVEPDFENFESFPHSESCPSLSSSFLTIDTSGMSFDEGRRGSVGSTSPDNFTASSASVTSPVTPLGTIPMHSFYAPEAWPKMQSHDAWQTQDADPESFWMASEESAMANCVMNSFPETNSASHFQPGYFYPVSRPKSAVDPPLSRAVFNNTLSGSKMHSSEDMLPWSNVGIITHPQTIEPSATFQAALPSSSPMSKYEPITPLRHHRGSSSLFASSPLSGNSAMLASQWDVEDTKYVPAGDIHGYSEKPLLRRMLASSHGSSPIKLEDESPRKSFSSKSGVDCEAIIPQNTYACSKTGCTKRFKRQEHKKRHERTVHTHEKIFPCWVVTGNKRCDRKFSRKDNLRSHYHKTHGRKSQGQRNAYVATLDPKSKYYDLEWTGPLTSEGLPIGHPSFPEIC
ncbi:hypothetical protein PMZ80_002344 [Knufia obscura]|uniref:C2H2 type master regulator of conidiophore development brlA n=2 Tax=Knufia TaxID=430999 RepID=A0AAN8ENI0_9EURO|nr:hypothetical protein PMZ80_002344 [Knufia obscura]KAK5950701.1 hypothetical protein OHC33_008368 [Knufia fluminis]